MNGRDRIAVEASDARELELDATAPAVLAISSQLAYGSVGLNAALPVYAGLGFRTVSIPSIVLSVMPHYSSVHDLTVDEQWLAATLDDLVLAGALDRLRAIAVGYLAAPQQARAIAEWYARLPGESRPPLILDPTLGDEELGFYTDPALAGAIAEWLLPVATGVLPNRFELAQLADRRIEDLQDPFAIRSAIEHLLADSRNESLEWAIVTGIRSNGDEPGIGELIVSGGESHELVHPYLETRAKGQGDTFTAALVCALLNGATLESAADRAASAVRARIVGP